MRGSYHKNQGVFTDTGANYKKCLKGCSKCSNGASCAQREDPDDPVAPVYLIDTQTPHRCTKCLQSSNEFLTEGSDKKCVACPAGQRLRKGGLTISDCTACSPGSFVDKDGYCQECLSECSECSDKNGCSACKENNLQPDKSCKKGCPANYKADPARVCQRFGCSIKDCLECSDNQICSKCIDGLEFDLQTSSCTKMQGQSGNTQISKNDQIVPYLLQRLPNNPDDPKFYFKINLEEQKYQPKELSIITNGILRLDIKLLSIKLSSTKSLKELTSAQKIPKIYDIKELSIKKNKISELIMEFKNAEEQAEVFSMVIKHPSIMIGENHSTKYFLKDSNHFYESPEFSTKSEKSGRDSSSDMTSFIATQTSISTSMEYGSSMIAIVFSALSMDPSGMALEFNRFLDLVKIFRYFGFWFVMKLNKFIDCLGVSGDLEGPESQGRRILETEIAEKNKLSRFSRYKFDKYHIPLWYQGQFLYMSITYVVLWVVKIIRVCFFRSLRHRVEKDRKAKLSKWEINLVLYLRQIHFVGFGVVMMKLIFYNTRIILHRKGGEPTKMFSYLTTTLLVFDFIELLSVANHLNYNRVSFKNLIQSFFSFLIS